MSLRIVKLSSTVRALSALSTRAMSSGGFGSGSGKGGGDGGSIRKAGGAFGEMEAAREDEYFRRMQAKQLHELKESMKDTEAFHKEQIKDYEDYEKLEDIRERHRDELDEHHRQIASSLKAIEHHKKMIRNLETMKDKTNE